MMTTQHSVSGTIEFLDVLQPALGVSVYVRVQDTAHIDAAAVTVAEQVIRGVDIVPGATALPFSIDGIPQNQAARYTVRVHADVDGNGAVSRGDYVSTESYPLFQGAQIKPIRIMARMVR
jgi:uncharacterized lipoprotein YbaY